ncbi:MAG: Rrf2 family transcriptional regulator [Caldicoprobacter sp.]|uniref:RrF2 family transcriptional regulator n=1 Tax=Caldicoprobacter sp. TaxID=2004500 RepID=UPI001D857999|nr:Rrf2 family transcriptional regulator [Clostridia bacterium]
MKISTRGRYGLRAIVDLALYSNSKGGYTALNSIAERQGISEKYLEQVFNALKKAGMVKSIKGSRGGYILACDSASTTVGDVLRVLEGELSIVEPSQQDTGMQDVMEKFLEKNLWSKINDRINNVLNSITIEDLVNEYRKMMEASALIYYI